MSDEPFDISDPDVAMRLASDLAGDLLKSVGGELLSVPMQPRVAFFQAYLAVLLGGMKVALGEQLARESFAHIAVTLNDRAEDKPRVH